MAKCPKCGSTNIDVQLFQEDRGSRTVTKTKSKYKENGHGCLWWIFIGSWWWVIDLMLWVFLFIPRTILHFVFHKERHTVNTRVCF